MNWLSSADNQF